MPATARPTQIGRSRIRAFVRRLRHPTVLARVAFALAFAGAATPARATDYALTSHSASCTSFCTLFPTFCDLCCDDSLSGDRTYGSFTVAAGTRLCTTTGTALHVTATTITIAGTLSADSAGQPAGTGTGAGGPGDDGGGGGGYGAAGANGTEDDSCTADGAGGGVYGDNLSGSIDMGSGGGQGGESGATGGRGGGAVWLHADTITITGTVTADGGSGSTDGDAGGGGSGGGILLEAGTLTCSGSLTANGGNGGDEDDNGGGGGGGRIKQFFDAGAACSATAHGGTTSNDGSNSCADGANATPYTSSGWDYDGDGHTGADDCSPANPDIYDGAPDGPDDELTCDGVDNDCNGTADNRVPNGDDDDCDGHDDDCDGTADEDGVATWYEDADGDGIPSRTSATRSQCADPGATWYTAPSSWDCDDAHASVHPGADEVCDGVDTDCDGAVDYAGDETDSDGDGYVPCYTASTTWYGATLPSGTDCDDSNSAVNPAATEVCDGVDNDCDDLIDANDTTGAVVLSTLYLDADSDGYGDRSVSIEGCSSSTYVDNSADCDDTNANVYPGAATDGRELCDGVRDDCDIPGIPSDERDNDGDGYVECDGKDPDDSSIDVEWAGTDSIAGYEDCDDTDRYAYPGVARHEGDDCVRDFDGDGYGDDSPSSRDVTRGSDCDDDRAFVYPQTYDACDGLDTNCSGGPSTDETDDDGDGWVECNYDVSSWEGDTTISGGDDCDDAANSVNPGHAEQCDGVDNDCDGTTDEDQAYDARFWYFDADGDGYGDPTSVHVGCDYGPYGYVTNSDDCDDTKETVYPGASLPTSTSPDGRELCDGVRNDCDIPGIPSDEVDNDGDGYVECDGLDPDDGSIVEWVGDEIPAGYEDCDDTDRYAFPGVARNEGDTCVRDFDGDGYGDDAPTATGVSPGRDCDDERDQVYPQSYDACDGLDTNCDGSLSTDERDADGDLYVACNYDVATWEGNTAIDGGGDCDDTTSAIGPGFPELCDTLDNDCDGTTDEDDAVDAIYWYFDADRDDYGDATRVQVGCDYSTYGYVDNFDDCNDADPSVYPFPATVTAQACDGQQNDCNRIDEGVPADEIDLDADGYVECGWDGTVTWAGPTSVIVGVDCDPTDPETHPGADEICDGLYNDCDFRGGATDAPADESDDDGDGYVECYDGTVLWRGAAATPHVGLDCDDADATVYPSAAELCDGQVNDCDDAAGGIPASEVDGDGDGYVSCAYSGGTWEGTAPFPGADCDDSAASRYPGAPELCDGQFDDCDLAAHSGGAETAPEEELDVDDDGFVACDYDPARVPWSGSVPPEEGADCNDYDATVYPAAAEVCDGQFDDCDDLAYDPAGAPDVETDDDGDHYIECEVYSTVTWVGPDDVQWEDGLTDCDDTDGTTWPGAAWAESDTDCMRDADGDGRGDAAAEDPVVAGVDCDDTRADVYAGADEVCEADDQVDNDCDGDVNTKDGIPVNDGSVIIYRDNDGDGFGGALSTPYHVCELADGFSLSATDCDDDAASIHPGAFEICNEIDEDCDLAVDEGEDLDPVASGCVDLYRDADGDGFGDPDRSACLCLMGTDVSTTFGGDDYVRTAGDCYDGDAEVRPGYGTTWGIDPEHPDQLVATEITERLDREDNDCDGYLPVVELDCDDDGSLPLLTGPNGRPVEAYARFTSAEQVGLERCDAVTDSGDTGAHGSDRTKEIPDCLGKPSVTATCDTRTGLWVVRYSESADGFGGRFEGGHRVETDTECELASDCDDACPTRCPGQPEQCDGVDNDCTGVLDLPSTDGIPAAMTETLAGTIPTGEVDIDADGAYDCELTGGAVAGESLQLSTRDCADPLAIGEAPVDCDNLCTWRSPSAEERCDGFADVCGGPGEGIDGDDDGHETCGPFSGGDLDTEDVFVLVHVAADTDTTGSRITPLLLPRRDAGALDSPDDPAIACDDDLYEALVARLGQSVVDDAVSRQAYGPILDWCASGAGGGRCEVVHLTLDESADDGIEEAIDGGFVGEACAEHPEQLVTRTVWHEERILSARAAVVGWECRRLYGVPCEQVTSSTKLLDGWDQPRPDLGRDLAEAGRWWKEIQRYSPESLDSGTLMSCWGDPTVEDGAFGTGIGGDCSDDDPHANREMPEGPADLVAAYWDEPVDCATCFDGVDNNCDGNTDCEDPTCTPCFVGQGLGCAADDSPCASAGCAGAGVSRTAGSAEAAPWLAAVGLVATLLRRRGSRC